MAGPGPTGYNETADILTRTVDGVPFNQLYQEIVDTLGIINANRSPLVEWLTFPVTSPYEEIMPITEHDFEEADEYAQPVGIRLGRPWNMGFDMRYYDLAQRFTFRYLGRARSGHIRALNATAIEADRRLVARKILTQLFTNQTRQATLEDTGTVVNVYPLYNGSQTVLPAVPPSYKTYSHLNTHDHYLATGSTTFDSGDLDDMWFHIYHHGYTQGAQIFAVMNREQAQIARKFRVATGDQYDFIPAVGSADARFRGTMVGSFASMDVGGINTFPGFFGQYGDINLIQEDYVPAKYVIMFASGGRFSENNIVGLREHENPELRGLKLIPQFERYPLRESFYHHALGTGTRHPGAGVVSQMTAGSYTPPTLTLAGPGGR